MLPRPPPKIPNQVHSVHSTLRLTTHARSSCLPLWRASPNSWACDGAMCSCTAQNTSPRAIGISLLTAGTGFQRKRASVLNRGQFGSRDKGWNVEHNSQTEPLQGHVLHDRPTLQQLLTLSVSFVFPSSFHEFSTSSHDGSIAAV